MTEFLARDLKRGDIVNVKSRSHGVISEFVMKVKYNIGLAQEGNRQVQGWDVHGNYISIGGGTNVDPISTEDLQEIKFRRRMSSREKKNKLKKGAKEG